jgi:hypothetical protein
MNPEVKASLGSLRNNRDQRGWTRARWERWKRNQRGNRFIFIYLFIYLDGTGI